MTLTKIELLTELTKLAAQQGLTVHADGATGVRGEKEAIKVKWLLGGKKSTYAFSCNLDEANGRVAFRESVTDRSWGLQPPTFQVESYSQSGTAVKSTRVEKAAVGGGGTIEFGKWREACAQAVERAGWRFDHQPLGVP